VGNAAGLHNMAEQAEIAEIEAHRVFPSFFTKSDYQKYLLNIIYLELSLRNRRSTAIGLLKGDCAATSLCIAQSAALRPRRAFPKTAAAR